MGKRIEICGGIASGKTTLSHVLEGEGFTVINERFQENPFLNKFYLESGIDNSFETEIVFTLLHYNSIKLQKKQDMLVCDYSLFQDYCYAINNLNEEEFSIFKKMYDYLLKQINSANLIVYLECDVDCLLERIRKRGREMEQSISREYMVSNIAVIEKNLSMLSNVLVINSHKYNFIEKDRQMVVDTILRRIADI